MAVMPAKAALASISKRFTFASICYGGLLNVALRRPICHLMVFSVRLTQPLSELRTDTPEDC
jgi:hypothetical protein